MTTSVFPSFVPPMMANSAKEAFDDPDWIFEPKLDGYRTIAVFDERGSPHLWSRNGLTLETKFPGVLNAASRILTEQTATGRQRTMKFDAQGRAIEALVSGLLPIDFTYYTNGSLHTITQGTGTDQRTATFVYDTSGYLHTISLAAPSSPVFKFQPDGPVVSIKRHYQTAAHRSFVATMPAAI
jgi:YD repeat-containing protein